MVRPDLILGPGRKLEVINKVDKLHHIGHKTMGYLDTWPKRPLVREVKTWCTKYSLPRGTFSDTSVEQCVETQEWRAIKHIFKSSHGQVNIDYQEAQRLIEFLEKVWNMQASKILGLPYKLS